MIETGRRKSEVWDWAEKLRRGEITPGKAKEEVLRRGFGHELYVRKYIPVWLPLMIVGCVFCSLPFVAEQMGLEALAFFAKTLSMIFPTTIKIATGVFFAVFVVAGMYATYLRIKKGEPTTRTSQ